MAHQPIASIRFMMEGTSTLDISAASASLLKWIADSTGATDLRASLPDPAGRSREIWLVDGRTPDGMPFCAVVRHERGAGPFSDTSFTLAREGAVLRALEGSPIPAPRVLAVSEDGNSLLIERLPGTASFTFSDSQVRDATIESYLRILVALHKLDTGALDLPFERPPSPKDAVLMDLREYRRSYDAQCAPRQDLDAAFAWLEDHAPAAPLPPALLQGDAGPGNFMHLGGRVTGLIDWEASHLGDPMDDLAWLWFRKSFLRSDDDLEAWFKAYESISGGPVDVRRVSYFRVAVLVRCAVAVLVRQAHDPAGDETKPRKMLALVRAVLRDPYGEKDDPESLPPVLEGRIPKFLAEG